tara:strand:- start:1228 stop:1620 length:393 start_codon:yes stop_codon:yes gene_type:complete
MKQLPDYYHQLDNKEQLKLLIKESPAPVTFVRNRMMKTIHDRLNLEPLIGKMIKTDRRIHSYPDTEIILANIWNDGTKAYYGDVFRVWVNGYGNIGFSPCWCAVRTNEAGILKRCIDLVTKVYEVIEEIK